ncbi:MAG: hypothetical protein ACRDBO_11690 [Lachnospiraceae bacterium]
MKKIVLKIFISTAVLVMGPSIVSLAGWGQNEKGYYYQFEDGYYAKSSIRTIDGNNYAFDDNGYMLEGWQYISFNWYYLEPGSGIQVFGWKSIDGVWYYLDPANNGVMYTYWLELGNNRYYFDERGRMQIGGFYLSDDTTGAEYAYETDANGVLKRNKTETVERTDANGNTYTTVYKYDTDGKILYRNEATSAAAKASGDDVWQYLLKGSAQEEQAATNQQIISQAQAEMMNERYQKYKSSVATKKAGTDARKSALSGWESITRRKLSELMMSDADIDSYIESVKNGTYRLLSTDSDYDDDDYDDDDYDDDDLYY